jgi:uncharacterized protein (TIGR00299 family) protein
MKVLHFDCFSGISGDMTLAALVSAGVPEELVHSGLASLGLPVSVQFERIRRGGFAAVQVRVQAPQEDEHRFLPDIEAILDRGQLTAGQKELALRIFRRLAEAEAAVHGIPVEKVHFHEVGALDSIADIVGTAIALDSLGIERFTARPVPTGHGSVRAAHGLMPIPTPATAELLKGAPLAASPIAAELTTPTGAAILTTLVHEWSPSPVMRVESIGYGAGHRDFVQQANLLRIFLGRSDSLPAQETDRIWVVETNLDNLPADVIGYCTERLFAAGALDVFTQPVFMKKNRPGTLLTVLVPDSGLPAVEEVLFAETTTLGLRRYSVERRKLQRRPHTVSTPWGPVQGKLAWSEGRPAIFAPEYEDCARIARSHGVPLRQVYQAALAAYAGEVR